MFDIGFSELLLVLVIGLVVLGPERLPVAVRTVAGWIRALRAMAASVQNELSQELKLQELQDSLKKAEESGLKNFTPEIKASMDELKEAAESMKRSFTAEPDAPAKAVETASSEGNTIHNPVVQDAEAMHDEGISPATASHVASSPAKAPQNAVEAAIASSKPAQAEATVEGHVASAPLNESVQGNEQQTTDCEANRTDTSAPTDETLSAVKPTPSTHSTGER
ncbi:Sec-independent protein translocase protein TatB [Hafnia psychrotolerans]|uniref:Sec-independent protein translocase protein TatB n=1 Tax=Hafnia psychrotolerans TaxID=1477018 RepID=A0ABQ1H5V8_9GAMM|nr:Sec-independent protein translocase protein TatB [Hafnia psychrotolerans]GGA59757.1 sec-independent protein translocase protein TatB [Hafnia psychrotolerans]